MLLLHSRAGCVRPVLREALYPRKPLPGSPGTWSPAWLQKAGISASTPVLTAALDQDVSSAITAIHAAPTRASLTVTGGGVQAISWLLGVPGASRTVLDVQVPYSPAAMQEMTSSLYRSKYFTPSTSSQAALPASSEARARDLAKGAYRRAARLSGFGTPVLGMACTAALHTDRTRRGEDKVFVSSFDGVALRSWSLMLDKSAPRTRWEQDGLASRLLVAALAQASNVQLDTELDLGLLETDELVAMAETVLSDIYSDKPAPLHAAIAALCRQSVACVEAGGATGRVLLDGPRAGKVYLSGSFNPLHFGHRQLLEAALQLRPGSEGAFELAIENADKGLLEEEEILRRVSQFEEQGLHVLLTSRPLYSAKAELLPGSTFVVGHDTAIRLLNPKYYGSHATMLVALKGILDLGCSFLVAGRVDSNTGKFMTMADIEVPHQLAGLFQDIPESVFRADISSTEIRARLKQELMQ